MVRPSVLLVLSAAALTAACSAQPSATTASPATTAAQGPAPVTIFTHCGFWEIDFDARRWTPISIGRGAMPPGTDSLVTAGIATLVSDDLLVFEAGSGLVVEFGPAPPDLPPPPPCD